MSPCFEDQAVECGRTPPMTPIPPALVTAAARSGPAACGDRLISIDKSLAADDGTAGSETYDVHA